MISGSFRSAEPLHIDLPNMLLESLSTALVKEVIWPRLAETVRSALAHALIWVSLKSTYLVLKRDAAARAIFFEVFDEMMAENAEQAVDEHLPGYPPKVKRIQTLHKAYTKMTKNACKNQS